MVNSLKKTKAVSIIEYSILIGVVVAALLTMSFYLKGGISGSWRQTMDSIGGGRLYFPSEEEPGETVTIYWEFRMGIGQNNGSVCGCPKGYTTDISSEAFEEFLNGSVLYTPEMEFAFACLINNCSCNFKGNPVSIVWKYADDLDSGWDGIVGPFCLPGPDICPPQYSCL